MSVCPIVRIQSSFLDMMGSTVLILIYADLGYWSAPEQYPSQVEQNAISCSKVQTVGLVPAVQLYNLSSFSIFFTHRFEDDIEYMIRSRPGLYWQITWRFVSPLIVLVIFVASLVNMGINPMTYSAWIPNKVGHSVLVNYEFFNTLL